MPEKIIVFITFSLELRRAFVYHSQTPPSQDSTVCCCAARPQPTSAALAWALANNNPVCS